MQSPVLGVLTVGGSAAALHRTYESLAAQTDRRWPWCVTVPCGSFLLGLPRDPRVMVLHHFESRTPQRRAPTTAVEPLRGRWAPRLASDDFRRDRTPARGATAVVPYPARESSVASGHR